jgi:NAD(P)-dependent dehydrogenase (short-subunit alcohol dehydrogenase family)
MTPVLPDHPKPPYPSQRQLVPGLTSKMNSRPDHGEAIKNFGSQVPMKRAGQPAELATAYVMLADPLSSYTSGTTVAVTGDNPFI